MKTSDKEMQKVARRLQRNLYILMGCSKPVKVKELAAATGVSSVTISNIKNDYQGLETPKLETIVKLSVFFGVDVTELLKEV